MAARGNPRLSVPIEDEYTVKRRLLEENLNEKKKLLREEFDRYDEKMKSQDVSVLSQNEIKFKTLLSSLCLGTKSREKKLVELNEILVEQNKNDDRPKSQQRNLTESNSNWRGNSLGHFRSQSLDYFSYRKYYNLDNLNERLQELRDKYKIYEDEIVNEDEKREAYLVKTDELVFSICQLKTSMGDIAKLNNIASKRFYNMENISEDSKMKLRVSHHNYKQIKTELDGLQEFEERYMKLKQDKFLDERTHIKNEEEHISKTMVSIEEAKKKIADQETFIEKLNKEREVLNVKVQQTFLMEEYLWLFMELEKCFLKGKPDEYINSNYLAINNDESLFKEINKERSRSTILDGSDAPPAHSMFDTTRKGNPSSSLSQASDFSGKKIYDEILSSEKISSKQSRKKLSNPHSRISSRLPSNNQSFANNERGEREEFQKESQNQKQNRLAIIEKMENFYASHPSGPDPLSIKIVELHRNMQIRCNSMKNVYEDFCVQIQKKSRLLEECERQLEIFKDKNPKLIETEYIEDNNEKISQDAGLFKNEAKKEMTTLNIYTHMIDLAGQMDILYESNEKYEIFLFKCYFFCLGVVYRISSIVSLFSDIWTGLPLSLENKCKEIITINEKKFRSHSQSINKGKRGVSQSIKRQSTMSDEINLETNRSENGEVITLNEIEASFKENFPSECQEYITRASRTVFERLKSDKVFIYFCSSSILNNFIERRKEEGDYCPEDIIISIHLLKHEIVNGIKNKCHNILNEYETIMIKILELRQTALEMVKTQNPKFRLYLKPQIIKVNKVILSATERVIAKLITKDKNQDENEPLQLRPTNELQERKLEELKLMDGEPDQEFMINQINKASLILKTNDPTYKYKHRDNRTKEEMLAQKHLEHLKQLERIKTDEEHLEYQRNLVKSRGNLKNEQDHEEEQLQSNKNRNKSGGLIHRLFGSAMKEEETKNMRQFYSRAQILNRLEKLEKSKGNQPASVDEIRSELRLEKSNKTLDFKKEIGYNPAGRLQQSRELRSQLERSSSEDQKKRRSGSVKTAYNKELTERDTRFVSTSHSGKRFKVGNHPLEKSRTKAQTLMRYSGKTLSESDILSKVDSLRLSNQYLKGTYFVNPQILSDENGFIQNEPRAVNTVQTPSLGIFKNFPFFANSEDWENILKPLETARKPGSLLVGLESKPS